MKKIRVRKCLFFVCCAVLLWPILVCQAQDAGTLTSFAGSPEQAVDRVIAQQPVCPDGGYTVEDAPYSSFNADNISATGTPVTFTVGWDDYKDIVSPFPIPFYCNTYTTVRISSEGYINFADCSGL